MLSVVVATLGKAEESLCCSIITCLVGLRRSLVRSLRKFTPTVTTSQSQNKGTAYHAFQPLGLKTLAGQMLARNREGQSA